MAEVGLGPPSRGVDCVLQAVTGPMSITGAEGEAPSKLRAPLVDMVTGYHAAMAVLAALQQRVRGKVADLLDVNLFAGVLMLQQVLLSGYLTAGDLPRRCGSGAPCSAPNEATRPQTDTFSSPPTKTSVGNGCASA
jgi:crotonobetainyl-CoA:carnitine CoA-transferase CaiB-like acyl-CoA transferase